MKLRVAVLAALAAGLVAHSLVYSFVCDDAFISFVYSRNLAEHGQLVFNLGDRVEGYSNFLWTVLLAALMKLGAPPEHASRVLGTAAGAGVLFVAAWLLRRLRRDDEKRGPAFLDLGAPALLAASAGFACWCSGGLETQLFTLLVAGGLAALLAERLPLAGLLLGLSALTRPEGLLVFGVAALHRALAALILERRWKPHRAELLFVAAFLALVVPHFVFRLLYYGYPFPNTAYVKVGGHVPPAYEREMLRKGLFYAWQWATQSGALFAAPLALLGVVRRPRAGSLLLLLVLVYLAYAVRVGGDFMGLHRFVMPLFFAVAVLVVLGLDQISAWLPGRARIPAAAALLVAVLALHGWHQVGVGKAALVPRADNGIDRPGYLKVYADDRGKIGKALLPHLRPDDFSIVGGVGVQPYYGRMRAIDVFGLVSADIAHNEPPTNPRPGHQKWARPERLLKLDPTFVFHCYDLHRDPARYQSSPSGGSPRPLCGEQGFWERNGYVPTTIHVPGLKERGEYYTFLRRKDRAWP